MKTKTCMDCLKAATNGYHDGRSTGCPECDVRSLAMGTQAVREAAFDHVERWMGPRALAEIKSRVFEERARIQNLRGQRR